MRTLLAVVAGFALAFGFVFAGNIFGSRKIAGATVFLVLWVIFCVVDYANGVKAGYPASEELGIHILIFVVPALGAWLATRLLR